MTDWPRTQEDFSLESWQPELLVYLLGKFVVTRRLMRPPHLLTYSAVEQLLERLSDGFTT